MRRVTPVLPPPFPPSESSSLARALIPRLADPIQICPLKRVDEDRRAGLRAPGQVGADVADVDVTDETVLREVADAGEDLERGDLTEVGEGLRRIDRVAELVLAERCAEVEVSEAGQDPDRMPGVSAQRFQADDQLPMRPDIAGLGGAELRELEVLRAAALVRRALPQPSWVLGPTSPSCSSGLTGGSPRKPR
jgi:hypothetical protein